MGAAGYLETKEQHIYRHRAKEITFDNTTPGAIGILSDEVQGAIEELYHLATSYVSDAPYGPAWDGVTDVAPSKNAVYDIVNRLELLIDYAINARKYNRTPVEPSNGSRVIFTLPLGHKYVSSSLIVKLNGVVENGVIELSDTQFQVNTPAPTVKSKVTVDYTVKQP